MAITLIAIQAPHNQSEWEFSPSFTIDNGYSWDRDVCFMQKVNSLPMRVEQPEQQVRTASGELVTTRHLEVQPALTPAFEAARCQCLVTDNVDEFTDIARQQDMEIIQTRRGRLSAALTFAQGEYVQLSYNAFSGCFRATGQVRKSLITLLISDGGESPIAAGQIVSTLEVNVGTAATGKDYSITGDTNVLIITVDARYFTAVAGSVAGNTLPALLDGRHLRLLSMRHKQRLLFGLRTKLRAAACWPVLLKNPRWRRRWEYAIVHDVASLSTPGDEPAPPPARNHIAAWAEQHLRKNILAPIRMAELAAALGVSQRALHLGFQERYGLPPMAYLKALRLNGVRRDLRQAASGATVTEIALYWGFQHLGRFANDYRAFFGETPSETLLRSNRAGVETRQRNARISSGRPGDHTAHTGIRN